jgi:DNA-binding LacI/PurR family transcriptional regulator
VQALAQGGIMGITLADIAKKAKVSPSTVSRVISNHPSISDETRKKVLEIMDEMKFQPNIVARSLAKNSTKIIGVVLASRTEKALYKSFLHPLAMDIIGGMSVTAYKNDYNILLTSLNNNEDNIKKIQELALGGVTDGLIYYFSRVNDPIITELQKFNTPFVVVGKPKDVSGVNWVDNDNFEAAYKVTEMLIKAGRKKIAFAGASPNFVISIDKVEGYKSALIANNMVVDDDLIIPGKFITDNGFELIDKKFVDDVHLDAIIAQDDMIAFGIIKKIKEMGYRVPEDIAVVGFDNVPMADYFMPRLTSVDMNSFDLGAKACELLLSNIKNKNNNPSNIIIPSTIVTRDSV